MVKRPYWMFIVMGALCLALIGTSIAVAASNNGSEEVVPTATVTTWTKASAGDHARLVAYIGPHAANYVYRAKGVQEVTHPETGVYCIKPSGTWSVAKVVPAVTVEWGASSGNALLAFYRDDSNSCPAGYIEVRTYNFDSGTPVEEDTVAFTIVVP